MDEEIESLEIIVGTYEEFLLGYKVIQLENEDPSLIQSFANHSHRASVRSVAAGGKFLASGGTDESILLYDMVARKEAGLLMQHHGNINCVEFSPTGSHLVSGSEDGSIGVCRAGSWQLEKLWGSAHKGAAVTSVSVHPSGKLMLSVGPDGKIYTWNLVKGRLAYATVLCKAKEGRSVTQVLWSPDGETYAVVVGTRVEIFTVAAASIVHTIQLGKKVTCILFLAAALLCIATEDGDLIVHDIVTKKQAATVKAHEGRVRCMARFGERWVVTASSAGQIKVWSRKAPCKLREVCSTNTGCRITCLTAIKSAPLDELAKDDVKLNLADVECLEVASTSPSKRPRPLGFVTVEEDVPIITKSAARKSRKKRKKDAAMIEGDDAEEEEEPARGVEEVDDELPKKKLKARGVEEVDDELPKKKLKAKVVEEVDEVLPKRKLKARRVEEVDEKSPKKKLKGRRVEEVDDESPKKKMKARLEKSLAEEVSEPEESPDNVCVPKSKSSKKEKKLRKVHHKKSPLA